MKTIYFDMDGTIADLYSYENWLFCLRRHDVLPYVKAAPMLNMRVLARTLNRLQKQGYKLGVISWTSKDSTDNYKELVRQKKIAWLKNHLGSVKFDEIHIVKYGTPKHYVAKDRQGILFDDNLDVRKKWKGEAYPETAIMEILKRLL